MITSLWALAQPEDFSRFGFRRNPTFRSSCWAIAAASSLALAAVGAAAGEGDGSGSADAEAEAAELAPFKAIEGGNTGFFLAEDAGGASLLPFAV